MADDHLVRHRAWIEQEIVRWGGIVAQWEKECHPNFWEARLILTRLERLKHETHPPPSEVD